MKTLKVLKIASILQSIFCFFCIASNICFAITRYFNLRVFFDIGNVLIYGWIANPIAPFSFIICLIVFLVERKSPKDRQLIGKKWIWIFVWPVITTIFYFATILLLVALTGGV